MVDPTTDPNLQSVSFFADDYLPGVDWQTFAQKAMDSDGSAFFWIGLFSIGAGLVIRLALAATDKWLEKTPTFEWQRPVALAALFALIGLSYPVICNQIISFVTSLGVTSTSGDELTKIYADRFARFLARESLTEPPGFMDMLTAKGWQVASLQLSVHLSYALNLVVMFVLKGAQIYGLKIIVAYGPLLIGAASMGPFFHVLAIAWLWALIEVSAWTITMSVVLVALSAFTGAVPIHGNWLVEMFVSLFSVAMLLGVTKWTSSLIRGDSAGGVGMSVIQSMYGGANMAMNVARLSNKAMQTSTGNLAVKYAGKAMNFGFGAAGSGIGGFGRTLRDAWSTNLPNINGASGGGGSGGGGTSGSSESSLANAAKSKHAAKNRHFAIKANTGKKR